MSVKQLTIGLVGIGLVVAISGRLLAKDADGKAGAAANGASTSGAHNQGAGCFAKRKGWQAEHQLRPSGQPGPSAGIRVGDRITSVGGTDVSTAKQFIAEITKRAHGLEG